MDQVSASPSTRPYASEPSLAGFSVGNSEHPEPYSLRGRSPNAAFGTQPPTKPSNGLHAESKALSDAVTPRAAQAPVEEQSVAPLPTAPLSDQLSVAPTALDQPATLAAPTARLKSPRLHAATSTVLTWYTVLRRLLSPSLHRFALALAQTLRWFADRIAPQDQPAAGGQDADPSLDAQQRLLLENVNAIRDARVEDVQVPRADIVAVSASASVQDVVAKAKELGYARFPIIGDSLDDVLGMVSLKDLLLAQFDDQQADLSQHMRQVLFVAPSMPVLQLLQDMQVKRHHMAMVVDEFGGIDGLVTIEDLVAEIVGDISDKRDSGRDPVITQRGTAVWDADARLRIDDLEAKLGPILTDEEREEDIDTLGGLVTSLAGRVPALNEVIAHDSGWQFTVTEADPRRLVSLRLRQRAVGRTSKALSNQQ